MASDEMHTEMNIHIVQNSFCSHLKKRSAFLNTHIGPEENYI